MKPSAYYDHIKDVMEELAKFTMITRDITPYLAHRYGERRERAQELSACVNQASIGREGQRFG